MLEELEAQLATLPADATKHDMEPGFEVMARWIQSLDRKRRAAVLSQLPLWLQESHGWHSHAAMEMAIRVGDESLLTAAVHEAGRRRVVDFDLAPGEQYPDWLRFHLYLLSTISRWSGDLGEEVRAYLSDLRAGVSGTSYSRRLLAIRSWLTQCAIYEVDQRPCLKAALSQLRDWRDARLMRSGLTLLHAYFGLTTAGIALLKDVLTAEEFAAAFPKPVDR
jgi:hypothetical protein